jgi:hypothetical protein
MFFRWSRALCASCLVIGVTATASWAAPIVVNPTSNASTLVNALFPSGSGITVVGTPAYTGAATASGLFSGGTGILPFESGIVLTTGEAVFIIGPNNDDSAGVDNEAAGDAALAAIAGQGAETFNASILEFQFIPTGNTISFQFVFGSEEYNEFVGDVYNDVFAFFLNGTNIAVIPGTTTPITINSVNNNLNSQFYTDNENGALDTQLDGLVGVKMAVFAVGSVNPGVTNTIRLAIADTADAVLDSAVLIKGASFIAQPPPNGGGNGNGNGNGGVVPEPSTWLLLGGGLLLLGATKRLRRT